MEIWITILAMIAGIILGGLLTWIIGIIQDKILQRELISKLRDAVIDREHVSVNEEFLMTQLLAEKIQEEKQDGGKYTPDVIYAVCPGGAMIAEWLSRRFLGTRFDPTPVQILYMVPPQKRENDASWIPHIRVDDRWITKPPGLCEDSRVLLVNDISRTSHTSDNALDFLINTLGIPRQNIKSVALICHQQVPESARPDCYVAETSKLIRFDWKSYDQIDRSNSDSERGS